MKIVDTTNVSKEAFMEQLERHREVLARQEKAILELEKKLKIIEQSGEPPKKE